MLYSNTDVMLPDARKRIAEQRFRFAMLITCLVLGLVSTILHEPWSDEAQSWILAKDLNFSELIGAIRTEGHPILYHLVLKLFVYWMPFSAAPITGYLMGSVGMLFIYKSDMPSKVFAYMCISPLIFYYTMAFARSYALCLLFFGIIYYLYPKRNEHPLILASMLALAMNIHFMFTLPVAIFAFVWGIEQIGDIISQFKHKGIVALHSIRPNLAVCLFLLLGVWACFNQAILVDTSNGAGANTNLENGVLLDAWVSLCQSFSVLKLDLSIAIWYYLVLSLILLFASASVMQNWKSTLVGCVAFFGVAVLLFRVRLTTPQKVVFLLYGLLFAVMLIPNNSRKHKKSLSSVVKSIATSYCAIALIFGLSQMHSVWVLSDWVYNFDATNTIVDMIRTNVPSGSKLITGMPNSFLSAFCCLSDEYDTRITSNFDVNAHYAQWGTNDRYADALNDFLLARTTYAEFVNCMAGISGYSAGDTVYALLIYAYTGFTEDELNDTITHTYNSERTIDDLTYYDYDKLSSEFDILGDWNYLNSSYASSGVLVRIVVY